MKTVTRTLTLLAFACASLATRAHAGDDAVTLSGVVYTFNTPAPLAGATVAIAEHPGLSTVSDANGRYSLAVPDDAEITPVVSAPGYRTMHLQTFSTDGDDLHDVFVQLVPFPVYWYLATALGVDPFGPACNVASTVSSLALQGLSFEQLVAFGPEGVPGATVTAAPAGIGPIYFNASTLPDPSLSATSSDGGVLFLYLADGVHTLRASALGHRFAKVKVTCAAGRFINASPPWGLREKP